MKQESVDEPDVSKTPTQPSIEQVIPHIALDLNLMAAGNIAPEFLMLSASSAANNSAPAMSNPQTAKSFHRKKFSHLTSKAGGPHFGFAAKSMKPLKMQVMMFSEDNDSQFVI